MLRTPKHRHNHQSQDRAEDQLEPDVGLEIVEREEGTHQNQECKNGTRAGVHQQRSQQEMQDRNDQ